jgi:hypothetical protein
MAVSGNIPAVRKHESLIIADYLNAFEGTELFSFIRILAFYFNELTWQQNRTNFLLKTWFANDAA